MFLSRHMYRITIASCLFRAESPLFVCSLVVVVSSTVRSPIPFFPSSFFPPPVSGGEMERDDNRADTAFDDIFTADSFRGQPSSI